MKRKKKQYKKPSMVALELEAETLLLNASTPDKGGAVGQMGYDTENEPWQQY